MKIYFGTSVYQGAVFSIESYLDFIRKNHAAGGTATEGFGVFSWPFGGATAGWRFTPYLQIGTYQDLPTYPGVTFPIFDLGVDNPEHPMAGYTPGKRNEAVWENWRQVFQLCAELKTAYFLRVEDFCSLKQAYEKRAYPFRACIQRGIVEGDTNRTWYNWHGGYIQCVLALMKNYVELAKSTGVELFIVPQNEADEPRNNQETDDQLKASVIDYHTKIRKGLMDTGFPEDHIVINASRGMEEMTKLWPNCYFEYHGCNSPEAMREIKAQRGVSRVGFNGDGPDRNAQGIAGDHPSKRQPSVAQGAEMGKLMREWGASNVMFFARETEMAEPPDITRCSECFEVVKAMGKELGRFTTMQVCAESGLLPTALCQTVENREFVIEDVPTTPCAAHQAPPVPPTPPAKPCSYWFKRWDFRRWFKCIFGGKV